MYLTSSDEKNGSRTPAQAALSLPKRMTVNLSARKLRIAIVYSRLPFPMMRGDQLTVAHLLSFLKERGHSVSLFALGDDENLPESQQSWLRETCQSVVLEKHSSLERIAGVLRGIWSGLPMQVGYFSSRPQKERLSESVAQSDFDLVYVYYIRSAEIIPERHRPNPRASNTGPKYFLAMQLSQTLNVKRMRDAERSRLKRIAYMIELALLRRYESRIWRKFDRVVVIGPKDLEEIRSTCRALGRTPIDNAVFGAHGTDVDRFRPASPQDIMPGRIVFSGSMAYVPNIQAVLWFMEHCWNSIRAAVPHATFVIQGRDPTRAIKDLANREGVTVTGTVKDVGDIIRSAAVCINPMRAAGGMQNKLIEYMACGKAIVATSIANEGIGAPADALRLANSAEEFSHAIIALLGSDSEANQLAERARLYATREWTWEKHFLELEAEFIRAVDA